MSSRPRSMILPTAAGLFLVCAAVVHAAPPNFGGTRALNTTAPVESSINSRSSIAGDGSGNWVAVWQSTNSTSAPWGGDGDILVARSSDNGCTWSAPAAVDPAATTDSGGDVRPNVATDGLGNWVTVWISQIGGPPNNYRPVASYSTNNGLTWSSPTPLGPSVDGDEPAIAWGQGAFVATWSEINGAQYVTRSTNGGVTWSAGVAVSATNYFACCRVGDIATDGQGGWVGVWTVSPSTESDLEYAVSTDNGITWSPAAMLHPDAATDPREDDRPRIAADANGNWVVLSHANIPLPDLDIFVSRGTGTPGNPPTSWTQPVVVVPGMLTDGDYETDGRVDIATDGLGTWVAVWAYQFQLSPVLPGDIDIVSSYSTDNGLTWSTPALVKNTYLLDDAIFAAADFPRIATAGGSWIVTWDEDDPLYGTNPQSDREILTVNTFCGGLDHFLCYKAKKARSIPVTLSDALDTGAFTVGSVQRVCTPTDKNDEGLADADTHLTVHKLVGPHVLRTGLSVTEQFGSFNINTKSNFALMVPAAKTIPPALPPSSPPGPPSVVDHYRCLRFKFAPGSPPFPNNVTASAVDQFGTRALKVKKPDTLCIATDKNGEGVNRPNAHLMCHKVSPGPSHTVPIAQLLDQFGPFSSKLKKERELCIPATIVFPS